MNENNEIKYIFSKKGYQKPQRKSVTINKRDAEVFEEYFRTKNYGLVAQKFKCNERTVRNHAARFDWLTRLQEREKILRDETEKYVISHFVEDQVNLYKTLTIGHRHIHNKLTYGVNLKMNQYLEPNEVKECMDAMDKIIRNKRLIAGESTEKTEFNVKDLMEQLHEKLDGRSQSYLEAPRAA